MPLDPALLAQRPTNKLILKCGPEGVEDTQFGDWSVVVQASPGVSWSLVLYASAGDPREFDRQSVLRIHVTGRRGDFDIRQALPLGHVSTMGELIQIYERLSQKRWPGNE